ncbi:MAG: cytosine permease [Lachnospiraceae bacterium]
MNGETKGLGSVFFVFAGYILSVTAFVLGGNVGNQLGFTNGVLALLLGNMILALYAGVLGYIGKKAQKSSTDLFKPVYGLKGQVITSSIVSMFSIVFVSVYCSLVGSMVSSLFPGVSPYVGLVIYLAILTLINIKGFKGMSIFSKIGVPMIGFFVIYGLIVVGNKIGFGNALTADPTQPASFSSAVSVIAASWMTGATFSSDITRYLKKSGYVFIVTVGSFLCVTLLEIVALLCALGTGQSDLVQILSDLNMSAVAFVIYVLLTITSGQAVVFISAQALENIIKVVRGKEGESDGKFTAKQFIIPSCIFAGLVGVFMTMNGFTSTFLSMLGIIGTAIPPVGGTIVAHFLLVEREYTETFKNIPAFRWAGFIGWITGICVSKLITIGISPLNGFVTAVIVYVVIRKITDKKIVKE